MTPDIFEGTRRFRLLTHDSAIIRLNDFYGDRRVYMYADDPEDFAGGGNKVRFYEYLIPEIIDAKPDFLLTSGSVYSNHVRVTSEVCKRLSIGCRLLIEADEPTDGDEFPNIRAARENGAEIIYIGGFAAMLKIKDYADRLRAEGLNFYHVPNAGHTPGAVRAYAGVITDAMMYLDGFDVFPSEIWLPCASGTTMAGVLGGRSALRAMGINMPDVHAVAVGGPVKGAVRGVSALLKEADGIIEGFPDVSEVPSVTDCGKNDYGHPDEELLALRAGIASSEGITLDRTYNINAFYGMKKQLEENAGCGPVLYINTGGYTGD